MECKYCHRSIPDNSNFCNLCGKRQIIRRRTHRRRPKAQGTITKLNGRKNPYWARLPMDYSSGIPVRESLGCYPTYAAAAEAIAKALYMPEQRIDKKKMVTLQEVYEHFLDGHYFMNLTKGSQCAHRTAWKHLEKCAHVPLSEVNRDTFQVPIDALYSAGAKRETLAKVRNLASLLCREAMGLNLIHVNFGRLVQLPRADTDPAKPFSSDQISRIWNVSEYDKEAMTVLMLIYTGMRPGELLSTDIAQHLHIEGEYWYIQHGSKTEAGQNRIIPLPQIVHPIVLKLKGNRNAGPLIAAEQGGFWRLDNWRPRRFNPLMERLGFQGHTPYSCRHTYADLQKRKQVPPDIMMEIMGHKDYSMTVERYQTTTYEDIVRICTLADGFERPGNIYDTV